MRNIGSDLGGAVKGFKEGMKEAGTDKPAEPVPPQQQVSGQTIDVEVKEKDQELDLGSRISPPGDRPGAWSRRP